MKLFSGIVLSLLLAGPALAADAPKPAEPTVADLQKQVLYWQNVANMIGRQRDQLASELANQQVIQAATAAAQPAPPTTGK